MAATKISDIIVPEVFNTYFIERTAELVAFWAGGIVENLQEQLGVNAREGGDKINMPFFQDLSGDDELLSDQSPLTLNPIGTAQDVAVLNARGKAWGVNDLATALSGADPMGAIGDLAAGYWSRRYQFTLFQTLEGAFGAANMSGNVHDITALSGADSQLSASTAIDAAQKLGDAQTRLTAWGMHSASVASLRKQDLIVDVELPTDIPTSLPTFQGKRVIMDDGLPTDGTDYTSYLFGNGAVGFANAGAPVPSETDRDSLGGEDMLITRTHYVMHPRGVAWIGTPAGITPTNAELATGTNWNRVYENKNVRMVQFKHKLAP